MIFFDFLDSRGISYIRDYDIKRMSSIRVGGKADCVVYPKTSSELMESVEIASQMGVRYKIIGGCTNCFFSSDGFCGVIISTARMAELNISSDGNIFAEAGAKLSKTIAIAADRGLELPAELFGIPGSIGGAVRNNAGAFGKEIKDIFLEGDFYCTKTNEVKTLTAHDLMFSYRDSLLHRENIILLRAKLSGMSCDSTLQKSKMCYYIEKRRSEQPTEPSLGSFFKRQGDISAAWYIDNAGLKGVSLNDAQISQKHAGFLINKKGASSNDVIGLANIVSQAVYEKYRVRLIMEAEYID